MKSWWDTLRKQWGNLTVAATIRGKLILSQCAVILLLTLALGVSIYTFTCETLTARNREAYGKILNAAEVIMNDTLERYEDILRLILENDTVQTLLPQESETPGNGIFMSAATFIALERELSSYANGVAGVKSLYLFDIQGDLFYIDNAVRSMDLANGIRFQELQKQDWYQDATRAKDRETFLGYNALSESDSSFSIVKTLNRLNTQTPIGLLVLNVDKDVFSSVFEPVARNTDLYGVFYIHDGNLKTVYQTGGLPEAEASSLEEVLNHRGRYEITEHHCAAEDWEMLHVVKRENIFLEARQIRLLILLAGLSAALLMTLITIRQVYQITKPLYQLREDISLVGSGIYHFSHTYPSGEVGVIGQEFQRMVRERIALKERIQEEEIRRQASELELLQAQINPHFLYNTLDTLYWMAVSEERMEIANLTRALSDVFRLSLNRGKEFLTIREELKFIQDYLYIQNIRFDGKFIPHIEVDPAAYDWKIIKLIIQPFVENAIYHGLEPKMEQGNLEIRVQAERENLVITIADDGVGMDTRSDMEKGYAIRNVMNRIRLHYGDSAFVRLESEKGHGTKVTLSLPLDRVRDESA